jgi:DNA-binding NtrC family response regulator
MGRHRSPSSQVAPSTILVVDDDEGLRESYDLILGDDDRVLPAADGRDILRTPPSLPWITVYSQRRTHGMGH